MKGIVGDGGVVEVARRRRSVRAISRECVFRCDCGRDCVRMMWKVRFKSVGVDDEVCVCVCVCGGGG